MSDYNLPQGQPIVIQMPPDYNNQLACALAQVTEVSVANENLRHQLAQQQAREQAYSQIVESGNERTLTLGRNGSWQELMDCVVQSAYYLVPQPPLSHERLYRIELSRHGIITITESAFLSDARLIGALQQHGVHVSILKSQKNTAILLRTAVNRHIQQYFLSLYAGWQPDGDSASYWSFPNFSSCMHMGKGAFPAKLPIQPEAVVVTAVNQFRPVFDVIHSSNLRELVILLYHEAALHTLLRQLGYGLPLAFCLFAADENILSYLRKLLSWFADPPLTLDIAPNDFSTVLLFRKDQPLLVEDRGRLDHAAKNVDILSSALVNHTAPWKNGRNIQSLPLQAPIVLLSSRPSALSCAPEVVVLDFPADSFDRAAWLELAAHIGQDQDYLTAFCGYTSTHISELRDALAEGQRTALHLDSGQLTEPCRQTLGIFIGIRNFLNRFFTFAAPAQSLLPVPAEELHSQLMELLVQTSEKADHTSLADQFVEVARCFIQTGTLHTHHREYCPLDLDGVVLYDNTRLYFTSSAFFSICQSLTQSRPVILAALAKADLFCGAQTNSTTAQTRVTICNEYGQRRTVPVYSFLREDFEEFGDPLTLENEEATQ